MDKTLSVAAIQKGTVIDHIPHGFALKIVNLLRLLNQHKTITLGLYLPSKRFQFKDLIKIENWTLTDEEASRIAVLAPQATINIIENYEVIRKFSVTLPTNLKDAARCPNMRCITNHESVKTSFLIRRLGKKVLIQCEFCAHSLEPEELKNRLL